MVVVTRRHASSSSSSSRVVVTRVTYTTLTHARARAHAHTPLTPHARTPHSHVGHCRPRPRDAIHRPSSRPRASGRRRRRFSVKGDHRTMYGGIGTTYIKHTHIVVEGSYVCKGSYVRIPSSCGRRHAHRSSTPPRRAGDDVTRRHTTTTLTELEAQALISVSVVTASRRLACVGTRARRGRPHGGRTDDRDDGDGDTARAWTRTGDGDEWWCAWGARGACAWGGARTAHAYGCGERAEDERNDVVEQGRRRRREQHERDAETNG